MPDNEDQDVWVRRIKAVGAIIGPILTILVLWYQTQTKKAVDDVKSDTNAAAVQSAKAVKVAADLKHETKKEFDEIHEKQDANMAQWKAYHTKEPEDMEAATRALIRAEQKSEDRQASKSP